MKTLVTGAAGFIGSHVTRLLLDAGRDVRVLLRPGENPSNLEGLDVERVVGDIRDTVAVRNAVQGCERVFHLAAIYAIWMRERSLIYDVNVGGTKVICKAALEAGVERFVYTSSIAAVGVEPGTKSADEDTPFNLWDIANDYILSKYISEYEAREYIRQGLPAVVVNPAFPFGWGDVAPTPTGAVIEALMKGRFPGWFEGGINAVDVEDVARGHLLAEDKGRIGERYLLGNANLHSREFVDLVSSTCGVSVPNRKLPVKVLAGLGGLMESVADHVTGRQPFMTKKAILYSSQYLYYDCSKAREELGYTTLPIEDSIRRSVEWFRHRRAAA